jgi:glycosyltransferase involved in cell wall biosynthesis
VSQERIGKSMRVLWFSNVPTHDVWSLDRADQARGGGWIGSLKDAILAKDPSVQLAVAFPSARLRQSFISGGVTFFPILERQLVGTGVLRRWLHITDRRSVLSAGIDIVHNYNPDVVQFFGTERIFAKIIPTIDIPSAIHIQGLLTVCSRMWFRGVPYERMIWHERPMDLILGRGYLHDYFRSRNAAAREREILSECTCVLGRTAWDRRMAYILAPRARYYSCDETLRPEFWQTAWGHQERQRKVLYATMGEACYKGLETLLEAFELVRDRTREEVTLRIAGLRSESRIVSVVTSSLAPSRRGSGVTFLGFIGAREIAEELTGADVFIHPSHVDNSPNSVCEAMLVGTPIVSTNAGGIPSIVTDNVDGLLVQDGDPYAMAGAILEILNDGNLAANLSQRARSRAKERHDPDRIAGRIISVYESLIGNPRSATYPG